MVNPDPFQKAFIDHPITKGEAVRLEAVAGSGKTTTSVLKIKSIIDSGFADPSQIVFITFSNKSAKDLNKKYTKLTKMTARPVMSTCHSFSLRILKKYFGEKPTLLNDWASTLMMRDALEELGYDKRYQCKDKRALSGLAREFLEVTHWFKSILAGEEPILDMDLKDFNFRDFDGHPDVNIETKHFPEAFRKYEGFKKNSGQMDYSDLLYVLYTKLKQDPVALQKVKDDHPIFFIDECQDCDRLLMKLIYTMTEGNNLYTIFDTAQTIYGFRWAAPWMLDEVELKKYFSKVTTFPLEYNYRSTTNIVRMGNHVRSLAGSSVMAQPFRPETQGSVRFLKVKSNKAEGPQAVRIIQEYLSKGYALKDIVILARTNNYLKTIIEPALAKENIPYTLATKNRKKLFDKPIIQLYFDLISLVLNPGNEPALASIAPHIKGIGDAFIQKMKTMSYMGRSIFKVSLSPADSKKVTILSNISSDLEECSEVRDPSNLSYVLNKFQDIVFRYCPKDFTTTKDLDIINKALSTMVFGYFDDFRISDLQEIFDKVLLDFDEIDTEHNNNSVTLMTVHGSKGLEFPVTIAGDFARAMSREEDDFDESCILYVQLSRAIENLIIFDAQSYVDYKMSERQAANSQPYKKLKERIGV